MSQRSVQQSLPFERREVVVAADVVYKLLIRLTRKPIMDALSRLLTLYPIRTALDTAVQAG
jgi:hypothetical protein